jgi:hypothetical protein
MKRKQLESIARAIGDDAVRQDPSKYRVRGNTLECSDGDAYLDLYELAEAAIEGAVEAAMDVIIESMQEDMEERGVGR